MILVEKRHSRWYAQRRRILLTSIATERNPMIVKYCRFQVADRIAYGIVEDDRVIELDGDLFVKQLRTSTTHRLDDVKLLAPCQPRQVLAMAGNYRSHLGSDNTFTTITTTTKLTTDKEGTTKSDSKTVIDINKPGEVPTKFQMPQV